MELNSVTYNGTTTIAISSGLFTWTAGDLALRVRPNLTWTATRGEKSASGATAQDAVDNLAATEAKAERAAKLTARSTKGQIFAREMRTYLHIGARTRRFAKRWTVDGHRDVMQAIADANNYRGSLNAEREAIFRTAFSALCSWEKHIDGYRTDAALISHINAMTPHQFVSLIGDMIDAGISNVGQGETFFAELRAELFTPAAKTEETHQEEEISMTEYGVFEDGACIEAGFRGERGRETAEGYATGLVIDNPEMGGAYEVQEICPDHEEQAKRDCEECATDCDEEEGDDEEDDDALPKSSVPAAFDRGHLYSPTLDLAKYALDDRYLYDYRPGDLFEPMPSAPRGDAKAFAWWWKNVARQTVPDFLGLREGDEVTIQHPTCVGPGVVVEALRCGAVVRYPMPEGANRPYGEMRVGRRNDGGHWYP